ncbi:hypothetical protein EON66_11130, partial [archaeon]
SAEAEGVPPYRRILACERCGAPRKFEVQLLPQLLNFIQPATKSLAPDARAIDIDYGTIAVFTCSRSCTLGSDGEYAALCSSSSSGSEATTSKVWYAEEVAWVQPMEDVTPVAAQLAAAEAAEEAAAAEAARRVGATATRVPTPTEDE